jgi:hypothetical protein
MPHVFLSYFVGTRRRGLHRITEPDLQYPSCDELGPHTAGLAGLE